MRASAGAQLRDAMVGTSPTMTSSGINRQSLSTRRFARQVANCAAGVDFEISTSSGVISAGMLANSGVLR